MFKNRVNTIIIEIIENSTYINNKIVKNIFVDIYLSIINRRLNTNLQSIVRVISYLFLLSHILLITYHTISIFTEFNYETKVLLFDWTLIFGGIPKYNYMTYVVFMVFGFISNIKFRLNTITDGMFDWITICNHNIYNFTDYRVYCFIWGPVLDCIVFKENA